MTKKEKLYKEYLTVKNKLNTLLGEGSFDVEKDFDRVAFRAKTYTKDELEYMIRVAETNYNNEVEKKRARDYFKTEEGSALKEHLDKEHEALENQRAELFKKANKELDIFIKDFLGKEWGVRYGTNSTDIGLVKEITEDGYVNFYFGHSFTIYHDTFFDKRFEMNYGCLGSFNLLDDEVLRPKYLMGMAKFANDKDRLLRLRSYLSSVAEDNHQLCERLDKIEYKLKHPLDNDDNIK